MIINHNIAAERSHRHMMDNIKKVDKSFGVLSSGERINKAGDNPAGLAVSEKMRAQIRGLDQAARNIQDGISFIQTAEGYLKETNAVLQRMRELSVQAANGTYTNEDRAHIAVEYDQLIRELNRIHEDAKFNTVRIFDGYSLGLNSFSPKKNSDTGEIADASERVSAARNVNFNKNDNTGLNGLVVQSGANTDERMFIQISPYNSYTLGLTKEPTQTYSELSGVDNNNLAYRELSFFDDSPVETESTMYLESSITESAYKDEDGKSLTISYHLPQEGNRANVSNPEKATETIAILDIALNKVNKERTDLGAYQNRLSMAMRGVSLAQENLTATESRIRDADMAEEYIALTKNTILTNSASSMLAQSNNLTSMVLKIIG